MANEVTGNIKIEGLDPLLRKLSKFGPAVYQPAVAEGATHIKDVIATYPARVWGRKQPPKTIRQRIFLIHAIAEGLIDFPYRRGISPGSEALGRRWTIVFRDQGKTAVVGNNASYGPLVHDPDQQSEFHQGGGWKTTRQIAEEEAGAVRDILARHIAQWRDQKA